MLTAFTLDYNGQLNTNMHTLKCNSHSRMGAASSTTYTGAYTYTPLNHKIPFSIHTLRFNSFFLIALLYHLMMLFRSV